MSHLTEVTTRSAVTIVDGVVIEDYPNKGEEESGNGKPIHRTTAAEAIASILKATAEDLVALEIGETRTTVLAAITKRREELTGGNDNVDVHA